MTEYDNIPDAELTRMVAVEVMGYTDLFFRNTPAFDRQRFRDFDPITVPRDRDMVVDAMREKGWATFLDTYPTTGPAWLCGMQLKGERQKEKMVFADTAGRAVCVAAVKAVKSSVMSAMEIKKGKTMTYLHESMAYSTQEACRAAEAAKVKP